MRITILIIGFLFGPWLVYGQKATSGFNQNTVHRNGFELSQLLVPLQEIKNGGVPKDGIPALTSPKFVKADQASYLLGKDLILGLNIDGITKAYPLKILDRHELINDLVSNQNVLVSHCPLCNSTIVFDPVVGNKLLHFGVSGLLYQSDVLMYDIESESLWSQLSETAISGKYSGKQLRILPSEITSWENWKANYPETLVLSSETGYRISYSATAYKKYKASNKLMFPVSRTNTSLANKEIVLGIRIGNTAKAYPISQLKKKGRSFKDIVGSKAITIEVNETFSDAVFIDEAGMEIPHIRSYWFAWYTFNTETLIYKR
jgi:hypothetical protein